MLPLLRRKRQTKQQAKLSEHERQKNMTGAFLLDHRHEIPPHVILVDDVITTGSTIAACAAVLEAAGVRQITAVGLAKG